MSCLLQERNSNEDISAWQCGRPDPRSIPTNSAPLDADESGGAAYSEEEMVSCRAVSACLKTLFLHVT
jgi:hypothetical protein